MLETMIGRLAAVALVATGLASLAMVGASACGGDAFTLASSDASVAGEAGDDVASSKDSTAERAPPGDDANDGDGATDGEVADTATNDAIALPDVFEEAPAHCATDQFQCIPSIPAGWEGPFEVYRGPSPAPPCSPNFFESYQGGAGIDAGPAACGCSCATATGVGCSPVTATFFVSTAGVTACTSLGRCTSVTLPSGQCVPDINASSECASLLGTTLFTVSGSTPDGGSCAPIPTTTLPDAGWGTATRACISTVALAQVDCPSGSLCAPKPALPFADSSLCIEQAGDVPCPISDYTNRSVSYGGAIEGRRCTDCLCGPVTGSSCSAYVDVNPNSASGTPCSSSNSVRYLAPQSCAGVQQPGDFRATATPQPGSCASNMPSPTGTVLPAAPTTFCCQ
jgi:hypothetical protein